MKHFASVMALAGLFLYPHAHGQTVCFNSSSSYSFTYNSGLRNIDKGDLNNDGNLDLVAGIVSGNTIWVVLGNGNGGFGAVTSPSIGSGTPSAPTGVKIHDFNGDGNADVAVSNRSQNEVSILLGNGTGGFGTATEISVPGGPSGITTGDFNEDGIMDLVVSLQTSGGFVTLVGGAGGTFTLGTSISTPSSKGVAVADFNEDGNLDVAIGIALTTNVAVSLGNGSGGFAAATNFTVGTNPYMIRLGDINSDGHIDIFTPNKTSGSFSVLVGTGTGSFAAADTYTCGADAQDVAVADYNEDGKMDVAVLNNTENSLSVFIGTGINTAGNRFNTQVKYALIGTPHEMVAGDFKEDTHMDLAIPPSSGTLATLAVGEGDGTFGLSSGPVTGTGPNSIAEGDFDNDSKKDLVTANSTAGNFSFFKGNNNGTYGAAVNFTMGTTPSGIYAVDVNHDGNLDVVTANTGSNNISVRLGNGAGSFGSATNFNTANAPVSLVCKDFNNDTHIDVATANSSTGNISVLLGTGTGSFGAATNFTAGTTVSDIAAGLMNADANLDIVVSNQGSNNVSVFIGTGTGSFGAATNFTTGASTVPMSLDIADIDGDGDRDVVTANNTATGSVSVLMGNGAGSLAAPVNYTTNALCQAVVLADFNNDGDIDIATANKMAVNSHSTVSVLVNSGTGTFGTAQQYITSGNSISIVASLINNDPLNDLAVANFQSSSVSILLNGTAIITPSGSTTFCSGSTIDLVSAPADSYSWTPGGATTQSITVGSSGTFSVTNSSFNGGCVSTSASVTVTVSGSGPSAPTITGTTTLCVSGSTTLTATPGAPSVDIEWYTAATGGIKVGENNSYTTPVLSTTTTYYVDVKDTVSGCFMPSRIPVTVNVGDAIDPVIAGMPANIAQNVTAGTCGKVVTWTAPTATDNCAMGTLTSTHSPGATFPVGTTTVTYTATDVAGNDVTASFTVTITDNINPTLSGMPSNITQNVVSGCSKTVTWTAPTASDNCSATLTSTHTSGASFPVGTTTVTYTATDPSGHTATGSFTVTIVDAINPTISGMPSNITQGVVSGCSKTVTWTAPTASDNCGTPTLTSSHASGASFPVGTTTVTYTATDAAGNTATSSFTITITDPVNPTISGMPSNITQNVVSGCSKTVTWTAPTASDNCGTPTLTTSHASGSSFPVGTTTVTYTATDGGGNIATATFTVTIVDAINPTISGIPSNITQNVVSGCSKTVTWTAPTASDNCGTPTLTTSHASGSSFPVGTTTVTYTATDASGNTATGSFTVTIVDAINPTIAGTPSNITQAVVSGCSKTVTWTAPTASDNCGTPTLTSSHASGSSFPVGTTTVTYTATDAAGNTATSSFTVTITDPVNPTISGMPSNITQNVVSGCSKTVTWTAPTASDNCGTPTLTTSHASGSSFPVGTTTVTYTATDGGGNIVTASFTVTIVDAINPTISGIPSNITQNVVSGCSKTVTWTVPTASDNCGTPTLTTSHASGSSFPVGTTTVTYTATDASGNTATGSFTVTIVDAINPTITGTPSNITQSLVAGCTKTVTWTAPTASDNCGTPTLTSSHTSGAAFPVGTTTVTYTATDAAGNTATSSFTVTITDPVNPTISGMPSNITQNVVSGCSKTVTWTAPTASDNCGTPTLTSSHTSGASFPVGTTTVTYTATDGGGNITTATFTVTIVDAINPTISGIPSNITQNVVSGCSKTVTWTAPTANDNCSATLTTSHAIGSSFPVGTTTVTYTATDASGNTATGSFTVTIVDAINPTITGMPSNINTNVAVGTCGKAVTWTAPAANDNCSVSSFTSSHASGSTFPVGTTTVTYTATDASGNTATGSFTVTVNDNELPVITGTPSNITMNIAMGTCDNVATWTAPTASDNCGMASFTSSHTSGSTFPAGVTTVTYTATDVNGNVATSSFTVTITDNINPTIASVPSNITQNVDPGICGAVVTWTPPVGNDNCTFTMTSTHVPGATFPVGTTTVTYTVTDPSANTATGSFTVTIVDNINPTITGMPANIALNVSPTTSCGRNVTWTAPTGNDNCTFTLTSSHTSGSNFPVGTTTVTYTITDAAGNTASSSFTITITDNIQPTIPFIANISQNVTAGTCGKAVTYTLPSITDNCAVATITSSPASGTTFPVGTTTVTVTATDIHGNIRTRNFNIIITDNIFPVIAGMPSNITTNVAPGTCGKAVSWTAPTASDNCSVSSLTSSHAIGFTFPVGTTTVTYTAKDPSNNTTTASFTVTVVDNINPTLTGVPSNITTNVIPGTCAANVSWTAPTASDNCSAALTTTNTPGSSFPVGTTTVTYTATDPSGLTATGSFTVTVTDNILPVIPAISDITVNTDAGMCGAVVSWADPAATDNCGIGTLTPSIASGTFFNTGTTNVTYTAADVNGNISTASFNVIVTDNEAPAVGTVSDITVNNDPGVCGAVVSFTDPTATDNCGMGTLVPSMTSGSLFSIGTTVVTYTATDIHGNTSTTSFNVTVNDIDAPTFTSFPADMTIGVSTGSCDSVAVWTLPTVSDNCGIDTLMSTDSTGSVFAVGVHTITYTLIDLNGNTIDSSFTVTVIDNEAPVVSGCPAPITQCEGTATVFSDPTGTDNCSGTVTVVQTAGLASGSIFPVGTTTVTFDITDAAGNTSTCSFDVLVNANPVVTYTEPIDSTCINYAPVTLSGGSPAGGTYSGSGVSGGVLTQTIAGVGSHDVIYTVTDGNGCTSSDTATIVVDNCSGVQGFDVASYAFNVYPNPSQGLFILEIEGLPAGEKAIVGIYNSMGEMVYNTQTSDVKTTIDLGAVARGMYVVKISANGFNGSKQMVIQR